MKNLEIAAIVGAYTAKRNETAALKEKNVEVSELKLPAAIAWKRRVNLDKLIKAKTLIDEALKEISEKYSADTYSDEKEITVVGEDGKETTKTERFVKAEFIDDFRKEQTDILDQDTDVSIKKVKIEELADLSLSDDDMDTLAFMIED